MRKLIEWLMVLVSSKRREEKKEKEKKEKFDKNKLESQKTVKNLTIMIANNMKIPLEFSDDGKSITLECREKIVAQGRMKNQDLITSNEIINGVGCDYWSDDQWVETFEAFFPYRQSEKSNLEGIREIFGRPGLIIEIIRVYVTKPELMSRFLYSLVEHVIKVAKNKKPEELLGEQSLMLEVLESTLAEKSKSQ